MGLSGTGEELAECLSTGVPSREESWAACTRARAPQSWSLSACSEAHGRVGELTQPQLREPWWRLTLSTCVSSLRLPDGLTRRGDINLLMLGDPGTAKSQLLKFVEKCSPIGVSVLH